MEWEPEHDFPGRQMLAKALDLSSRFEQREQTNQQKLLKQSTLINALCDQESRTQEHQQEQDDFGNDWKRFLKRDDIPLAGPHCAQGSRPVKQISQQSPYWGDSGSKWSTRTSTSGCMSGYSGSDIPFSDIPEIAWDCSSFGDDSYSDILSLVDCSNSITTNQDCLDTHSERNYNRGLPRQGRYASSDISSSDILPRSIRTTNSLPFTGQNYQRQKDKRSSGRIRTYTHSNEAYVIHELPNHAQAQSQSPGTDYDRRLAIEEMMKNVDLNGQLDILRILDPSIDIDQIRKSIVQLPSCQTIDEYKFEKIREYIRMHQNGGSTSRHSGTHSLAQGQPPPQQGMLRRSNSDPNIADLLNNQKAADRRKERDNNLRHRRIFRWLNSQKSQTARRKKQLARERQSGLFLQQEVVEVQNDETIDEQNEEIDVCEI